MWYRKDKCCWSGDKRSCHIGYDLWGWALPLLIDNDYGVVTVKILCFNLTLAYEGGRDDQ